MHLPRGPDPRSANLIEDGACGRRAASSTASSASRAADRPGACAGSRRATSFSTTPTAARCAWSASTSTSPSRSAPSSSCAPSPRRLEERVRERTRELEAEYEARQQGRGVAAPGAEDGGGRPADRRHRARLQQPADRRPRRAGSDRPPASPACSRIARRSRASARRGRWRCRAPSAPRRWSAGSWPSRASSRWRPRPSMPTGWWPASREMLRRTLGEPIALETVLAGGLWPTFADENQLENAHPQPRGQCARRDARRAAS